MKRITFLFLAFILVTTSFAQREENQAFESSKIKVTKAYNTPNKLNIDVLIIDNRTSSKLFSEKVILIIGNFIKESYLNTNINLAKNIRKDFNPEPDKIFIRIDVTIFDLHGNKVKRYNVKLGQPYSGIDIDN